MNALIVGTNKKPILNHLKRPYLLIDDGEMIDEIEPVPDHATIAFDVSTHSFDPLRGMSYKNARDFISILDVVFPEGESTLTHKNSNFILLQALLENPKSLGKLIRPKKDNQDAYQKIQTLLLSPVLNNVLNRPANFSFKGTIHAQLNRAELGDFDSFVLANLIISQYAGNVVIPDFGFYTHAGHSSLIRQGRLIAGINSFSEVPDLKNDLLLIDTKIPSHCTYDDALILAQNRGLIPGVGTHTTFVQDAIGG